MNDGDTIRVEPYRKRVRFKAWHVLVAAAVILLMAFVIWRMMLHAEVEAALQDMRDAGYPATPDQLNDWYAEPNGTNVALILLDAAHHFIAPDAPRGADRSDIADRLWYFGTQADAPNLGRPLDPDVLAAAERYLEANAATLAKLHEAAEAWDEPDAGSRYPGDYQLGVDLPLEHLGPLRKNARLLCMEAPIAAERGQADDAVDALIASFAVARSLDREPTLVSYLVALGIDTTTIEAAEDVMNRVALNGVQLARLAEAVADVRHPQGLERAIVGETAGFNTIFANPAAADPSLKNSGMVRAYRLSGLADMDRTEYIRMMLVLAAAAKRDPPESLRRAEQINARMDDIAEFRILLRLLMPTIQRVFIRDTRGLAHKRCAAAAIDIQRRRINHGALPADPNALLPADPWTGKPLHYTADPDGSFKVYSVGEDRADDGGARVNADGEPYEPGSDIVFEVRR